MIRRPPRSTPFPTRRSSDLDREHVLDRHQERLVQIPHRLGDEAVTGVHQLEHTLRRVGVTLRSEEHTSELQSRLHLVCRLLLEKKKKKKHKTQTKNKQSQSE